MFPFSRHVPAQPRAYMQSRVFKDKLQSSVGRMTSTRYLDVIREIWVSTNFINRALLYIGFESVYATRTKNETHSNDLF
jgi:hypothetical protein